MIFKKISDLSAIELGECSTLSDRFQHDNDNYQVEIISWHKPQKEHNNHTMQSTLAIYCILPNSLPCVHYEFFEVELTSDQMKEGIANAKKNISKLIKK